MLLTRALLALTTVLPPALAAQAPIVVDLGGGGDHTSLQAALDAAPPGATVLVLGGVHPVVRIEKPVRLLADPPASIVGGELSTGFGATVVLPCIELAGGGAGRVVLSGWDLSGTANGQFASGARAPIHGGGFDELVVLDSAIHAPEWFQLTGFGDGAAGIDVDVPRVWVERCSVGASDPDTDIPMIGFALDGGPGIDAPGEVVVLDSTVVGGDGMDVPLDFGWLCPCPSFEGLGVGGPAVRAASVIHAGSTLTGGEGGVVVEWDPVTFLFGAVLVDMADGVDVDAAVELELADDLAVVGPLAGGGSLDVSVDTALVPGVLAVSLPAAARWLPELGPLFFTPDFLPVLLPMGSAAFSLPLPPDVGPIGSTLVFQAIGLTPLDASRPVLRAVVP